MLRLALIAAVVIRCVEAADSSSLDAWLAGHDLPPKLALTLQEQGYHEVKALCSDDGASIVTDKQLKDWGVLPWHRRKLLAAVAAQARGQLASAAAPASPPVATEQSNGGGLDGIECVQGHDNRAHVHESLVKAGQGIGSTLTGEEGDRHLLDPGGNYTVQLVPHLRIPQSLHSLTDSESALGLLLDRGQQSSWSTVVSGVIVNSPAEKAGVLLGSTLLAVDGHPAILSADATPPHSPETDTTLIELVENATRNSIVLGGIPLELSLRRPRPLSAEHTVTLRAAHSDGRRTGRRGKRAAAKKKKTRKQWKHGDATERFHTALRGLRNIPLAEEMFDKSLAAAIHGMGEGMPSSTDTIDLSRPMELRAAQGSRPGASEHHQNESVRGI